MTPPGALRRASAWSRGTLGPSPGPSALLGIGLALLAGAIADALDIPLAWVLGPLVATAALAVSGRPVFAPLAGRRFGQATIGASIGLNVTPAVLLTVVAWLPVMGATAFVAIVLAAAMSVPFARASGTDGRTAFYAMMPGGLSEMANIGAAAGARPDAIALAQALRVALLVIVVPPVIVGLGIQGAEAEGPAGSVLPPWGTVLALLLGFAGVGLARLARLNNPWMIGAVVGAGLAAATGLLTGRIPFWLFYFGQFMIGLSIGARFRREDVMRLPRLVAASIPFILTLAALLFGYALLLSAATGLDLASAALGASPGGFAEMAVTAQTLHLSVGLVTGFHVVRAFLVNGFVERFWTLLERLGLFRALNGFLDRFGGR